MLNKYDFKYILKRVLVFIVVGFIMSLFSSCDVHALENKTVLLNGSIVSTGNSGTFNLNTNIQNELKYNGYAVFNVYSVPYCTNGNCQSTSQIKNIQISSTYETSTCEIGNQLSYNDNSNQVIGYSVKCPIQNRGTYTAIAVYMVDSPTAVVLSNYMGIYADEQSSSSSGGISQSSFDTFTSQLRDDLGTILTAIHNGNNQTSQISNSINNASTQAHQDAQQINDTITDPSVDTSSSSGAFGNMEQSQIQNGTISSLVLMPITLLQSILNGFNGSCSGINLGNIFDYDFILPCINPGDYIGIIWNIIDTICAGFIAYSIGKRMVVIFNNLTNLKDGGLAEAYD